MATRRQERLNAQMVEVMSQCVQELKDPRIGFITVTKADVSPDMRHAKVFVSVLGEDSAIEESLKALNHAIGHIQHDLGKKLGCKYTPRIEFDYDQNIVNADYMEQLIKEARASDPHHDESTDESESSEQSEQSE